MKCRERMIVIQTIHETLCIVKSLTDHGMSCHIDHMERTVYTFYGTIRPKFYTLFLPTLDSWVAQL